jgi:hypothetical protein
MEKLAKRTWGKDLLAKHGSAEAVKEAICLVIVSLSFYFPFFL